MAETFDAYHKWLGIPPDEQPPDHYRLLGLQRFETDADVIDRGADRQMTYLRSLTFAEHSDRAQKLLGEVSAARICLTLPDKKEAYDLQLREEQPAESDQPASRPTDRSIESPLPIRRPSSGRAATKPAAPIPVRATNSPRALNQAPALNQASAARSPLVSASGGSKYRRRRSSSWQAPVAIGVAILACVVVLILASTDQQPEDNSSRNSRVAQEKRTSRGSADNNRKSTGPKVKPALGKPVTIEPEKSVARKPSKRKQRQGKSDTDSPSGEDATGTEDATDAPEKQRTLGSLLPDGNSPDPTTGDLDPPGDPFDPSPPDDPPPSKRIAVPSAEAQKTIEQQIRDLYAADFKSRLPRRKWELGKKLLQVGKETSNDPLSRFVLLRMARDIAVKIGDTPTAIGAIDRLDRYYEIDALAMKAAVLVEANEALVPTYFKSHLLRSLLKTVDRAVRADRFEVALTLAESLAQLARTIRDKELIAHASLLRTEVQQIQQAFDQLAPALEKLATTPDDPQANRAAGQFYCLAKGDWQRGLPLLAAGEESPQQILAKRDLAGKQDPDEQIALAGAWWDNAEKAENDLARRRGRSRAAHWYRKALDQSPGGLAKEEIKKRLDEVAQEELSEFTNHFAPYGAVLLYSFERDTFIKRGKNYLVRDLSGNENHGLIHGARAAKGIAGGGIEFTKAIQYVECRHQAILNPSPTVTLAIWFKSSMFRREGCLIAKRTRNGGFVLRAERYGHYGLQLHGKEWKSVTSNSQFQHNVWNHLAASYDGKMLRLYIDGTQHSETPTSASPVPTTSSLRIGHTNNGLNKKAQFFGILDEVAIFNRALSADEIRGLYKMGSEGRPIRH